MKSNPINLYFFKVKISESRNLINVTVPALRRHEISVEELDNTKTSEYVKINRLDDKRVKVHYKPNVKKLQKLLNSNHALKFSVQYDVERKDEGGEIEVHQCLNICHYIYHRYQIVG